MLPPCGPAWPGRQRPAAVGAQRAGNFSAPPAREPAPSFTPSLSNRRCRPWTFWEPEPPWGVGEGPAGEGPGGEGGPKGAEFQSPAVCWSPSQRGGPEPYAILKGNAACGCRRRARVGSRICWTHSPWHKTGASPVQLPLLKGHHGQLYSKRHNQVTPKTWDRSRFRIKTQECFFFFSPTGSPSPSPQPSNLDNFLCIENTLLSFFFPFFFFF